MWKRKSLAKLNISLAMLLWILLSFAPVYAQPDSHATNRAPVAEINQAASEAVQRGLVGACANLLEAFKASDAHIVALESELNAQKNVNAALQSKITLLEQSLAFKTEEAASWRAALEAQKAAVEKLEAIAAAQDKRIEKLEAKAKRRGKVAVILGIAGLVGGFLLK